MRYAPMEAAYVAAIFGLLGALVRHLEALGLRCVYTRDIRTGHDALTVNLYGAEMRSSPTRPTETR